MKTVRSPRVYAPAAWQILLIAIVCVVVYGNSLQGDFVWDDEIQVLRNSQIRSLSNAGSAFTSAFWDFASSGNGTHTNFYRPIQTLSYMLAYGVGKLSAVPYHGISLAFHIAATVFVYLVCLELMFSPANAWLASSRNAGLSLGNGRVDGAGVASTCFLRS